MKYSALSEQVKKLRIDQGLSQEELSEKSNLSLRTIQRLENGESSPREDTLNLLTKALDVPKDHFNGINHSANEKVTKRRVPWYIISLTIIGCALGVILGMILVFSDIELPNDGVASLLVITAAVLFSGIGMLVGSILEKKFNQ